MHRTARLPFSILRRWGLSVQANWSCQSESLAATVSANAIPLCFNSECAEAILQIRASLLTYLRHSSYLQIRPQVNFPDGFVQSEQLEWPLLSRSRDHAKFENIHDKSHHL